MHMWLNESAAAEPTFDAPSVMVSQKHTMSLSTWSKLDTAVTQAPASSTLWGQDSLSRQLELYMEVPAIPIAECPLSWWAKNKATYSSVTAVARRMLAIPATSVQSERLFSKGRRRSYEEAQSSCAIKGW